MNRRAARALAVLFGVAGLIMLITGVGSIEYSFRTGVWSRDESTSPGASRILGAVLLGLGLVLSRLKIGTPKD